MKRLSTEHGTFQPQGTDLMARFDMASDRKDRLPEVRTYLENLRPQILKLQKELRLQTEEDIAGLDRRDDLKMNDVDVLVDLIQAFRKAWVENKVPREALERIEDEKAFERARLAFAEFAGPVAEALDRANVEHADKYMLPILAVARAGEPVLAWNLYCVRKQHGGVPNDLRTAYWLPARIAIFLGYVAGGQIMPISSAELQAEFDAITKVDANDSIGVLLVSALAEIGLDVAASHVASKLKDRKARLRALRSIFKRNPHSAVANQLSLFRLKVGSDDAEVQIEYWFGEGDVEKAMEIFENTKVNRYVPEAAAQGLAANGRVEEAFAILETARDSEEFARMIGTMARAFLEDNDLTNAGRAFEHDYLNEVGYLMGSEDAVVIVDRLLDLGQRDRAMEVVQSLVGSPMAFGQPGRAKALVRIVEILGSHDIDPRQLVEQMRQYSVVVADPEVWNEYQNAMDEVNVALPLREFKRAAARFAKRWSYPRGTFDRDAWEEKVGEVLRKQQSIADQLVYDAPLE